MITQRELLRRLRYDRNTGEFYWLQPPKFHPRLAGKRAGCKRDGYIIIKLNKRSYRAHRLVWLYLYGHFPDEIDHINRIGTDNRIENLRECAHAQNVKNHSRVLNGSGLPVGVRRIGKKFQARIRCDGKVFSLGCHHTPEVASAVYWQKRIELFGDFA